MGEFVTEGGQATELFEAIEKSFDQIACLVAMPVDLALEVAISPGPDDGLRPARFDGFEQGVAVVSLVGNDRFGGDALNERSALTNVGNLPPVRSIRRGSPSSSTHA